jgi:DNA-binding transcriptional MerR regulator
MGRKRSLQQIQQLDFLNIGEVHMLTGVRQSTLKFYCEIGILPFEQAGAGLNRKFNRVETLKRLDEISELKGKHLSIENIVDFFKKKDSKVTSGAKASKKERVTL